MIPLADVVRALDAIAPPRLAAEWDNVGLLLEGTRPVQRIVVCVDLTAEVLAECLAAEADLVVAYHPPLFRPVSRLTSASATGRTTLALIRAGVSLYAPHTALDAVAGGMTDWLVTAGGPVTAVAPIVPRADDPAAGSGRVGTLVAPQPLAVVVAAIKRSLGLDAVRVAAPAAPRPIARIAVCPGSGGGVVERAPADLVLTGELRHHDVLALVDRGTAVVLTDHTNSERGFLPHLVQRIADRLAGVSVVASTVDRDPLRIG
ncbi:MAG: Nif3-like dinuclear metal center hexameric protein [Myxococcota bacterium]